METYDTLQCFTDEQRVSDLEGSNTERIEMFLGLFQATVNFLTFSGRRTAEKRVKSCSTA